MRIGKAKKIACVAVALTAVLTLSGGGWTASAKETANETYPELKLVYDYEGKSSTTMSQALPLGNGYMGATVYGGVHSDSVQVNEHTLWSGGPGATAAYDGGKNDLSKEQVHSQLMKVRDGLQKEMTEFTENHSAYIDAGGKVVTSNYAKNATEITNAINDLKGEERTYFGNYQTFGNFVFDDSATAKVLDVQSNELATSAKEQATSLFDGNPSTKWYSIAGVPGSTNPVQPDPCWVSVEYSIPLTVTSYTIISGPDVPNRDPKTWNIYGSDDGENWTKIDERINQTFDTRSKAYTFELSEARTYSHFKMEIIDIAGGWVAKLGVQMCELTFNTAQSGVTDYHRTLDIDNSLAGVEYAQNGVKYLREYFVSYPDNVAGMRLYNDKNSAMSRLISFDSPQTAIEVSVDAAQATLTVEGSPADHTQAEKLKFAGRLKVCLPSGGTVSAEGEALVVDGAPEIVVFWTTGTNYVQCDDDTFDYFSHDDPLTAVSERIENACEKGYAKVKEDHIADYKELFDRVKLSLGDAELPEKFTNKLIDGYLAGTNTASENRYYEILYFQFGRYLLISSSRENTLPANLQGVWCNELTPRWQSDYHTNINLQMNYWAAQTANLAECHTANLEYIKSLVPRGRQTAEHYHCKEDGGDVRGWTTYHQNNVWGNTHPGTYGTAFYFPTAAAWLCQDIFDYYAFNRDKDMLDEYYDVVKEAALFWVDNLVTDARDGTLVSSPSYSPEHGPFSLGASADQSIIWELFRNTLELAEAKGDKSAEIKEIEGAMSRLSMPKIGLGGQLMEWKDETTLDITGDNRHRHTNHLLGLFPGTYISPGRSERDDEYAAAIKETLRVRGESPREGAIGWAFAWRSVIWAKLYDGDKAYNEYSKLLKGDNNRKAIGDNLFDIYEGTVFQIDANLGGVSAVTEMLLSSQNCRLNPLAALPENWSDGSYKGLRARGDFTVDAVWKKGRLEKMSILSGSGEDCTLAYDEVYFSKITCDGKNVDYTVNDDGTVTFETLAGKTYEITNHASHDVAVRNVKTSTCTENGYTGDRFCVTCNEMLLKGAELGKKRHTVDENGICTVCGYDATITVNEPSSLSGGAIAGICVAGVAVLAGGGAGAFFLLRKRSKRTGGGA